MDSKTYTYLGDLSATPPQYTRHMECDNCMVSWGGCWDNFMCPKCGGGDLPSNEFDGKLFKKEKADET